MARFCLSTLVSLWLFGSWAVTPAAAQGLLGSPFVDTEFIYYRPDHAAINQLDDFIPGVASHLNLPLLGDDGSELGLDAYGRFRGLWIDGTDSGVNFDFQIYTYSVGTNLFLHRWQRMRPWIGTGYQHSDFNMSAEFLGNRVTSRDRGDGFEFTVGVEADVCPVLAVRNSLEFNTEGFNGDDFRNPTYLAEFIISPPTNHWYLRLGTFVDFDGNAGALSGVGARF